MERNWKARGLGIALTAFWLGAMVSTPVAARGGAGGGGGGGGVGGGGATCDLTPVLPTLAPFPDILVRESFGPADGVRPNGGKGCNTSTGLHSDIAGYWAEWPANKNAAWIAPAEVNQTWRLCVVSGNIYEMPSPLQATNNGCMVSNWIDPVTTRPTALLPFTPPNGPYEIHLDLWPGLGDPTYYVGFGVTDSAVLDRNLATAGGLWFELGYPNPPASVTEVIYVTYNVRTNGRSGPVLATGTVAWMPWMPVDLRYDPLRQLVSASLNGVELGAWPVAAVKTPKYIGIEGVGVVDNLVVRKLF
jgi:hypothetical protein